MTPTCHTCGYRFAFGEQAWATDWKVIDTSGLHAGVRVETRYTCDDCEGSDE